MASQQSVEPQGLIVSIVVANAVAFGALLWDHISLLPHEYSIYTGKRGRASPSSTSSLFSLLRYAGLIALIPSLLFASVKTAHCQAMVLSNQVGAVLTVAVSGLIFIAAAAQRWERNMIVYGGVGLAYVAMVACSCVAAAQFRLAIPPDGSATSTCQLLPLPALATLGYGASLLFDLVILLLLIKPTNPIHSVLIKSDHTPIIGVGIASMANLVSLIPHAMNHNVEHIKLSIQPFVTLILVLTGIRVFLNTICPDIPRRSGLPTSSRPVSTAILNVARQPTIMVTPVPERDGVPMKSFTVVTPPLGQRPDTPFSSYDYESDGDDVGDSKEPKPGYMAYITRETVVTVG